MRHISIDIETYSEADIGKVGHFRYIDDASFEIMLVAYSDCTPNAEVSLVSLKEGEALPESFVSDLFDPAVVKHAFNASFEWFALSKYFRLTEEQRNDWLKQWECTMVHAAYLAYPTSLQECGSALQLPQDRAKDRTGKALIALFCCLHEPKRTNGWRTRILPEHEPEKWALFKKYNMQDVVAEKAIEDKFRDFPVPKQVFDDWRLNEIIVNALTSNRNQDFLGSIYMDLNLANHWKGQFFTPYSVCECMAAFQCDSYLSTINKQG